MNPSLFGLSPHPPTPAPALGAGRSESNRPRAHFWKRETKGVRAEMGMPSRLLRGSRLCPWSVAVAKLCPIIYNSAQDGREFGMLLLPSN